MHHSQVCCSGWDIWNCSPNSRGTAFEKNRVFSRWLRTSLGELCFPSSFHEHHKEHVSVVRWSLRVHHKGSLTLLINWSTKPCWSFQRSGPVYHYRRRSRGNRNEGNHCTRTSTTSLTSPGHKRIVCAKGTQKNQPPIYVIDQEMTKNGPQPRGSDCVSTSIFVQKSVWEKIFILFYFIFCRF